MWRQRVYRGCLISGLLLVMCCASVVGLAAELSAELVAYPSEIRLETPGAQQRLVVERVRDGLAIGDVTDGVDDSTAGNRTVPRPVCRAAGQRSNRSDRANGLGARQAGWRSPRTGGRSRSATTAHVGVSSPRPTDTFQAGVQYGRVSRCVERQRRNEAFLARLQPGGRFSRDRSGGGWPADRTGRPGP